MNLAKAEELALEYEIEFIDRPRFDTENEFGFGPGVMLRAERKRFDKIVSDYAKETVPDKRWSDYRALVEELRSEEKPEHIIQEVVRQQGRDWLQIESEERIERLIKDSVDSAAPGTSRRDLDRIAEQIRNKERNTVACGEEEARKRRLARRHGETRFRLPFDPPDPVRRRHTGRR